MYTLNDSCLPSIAHLPSQNTFRVRDPNRVSPYFVPQQRPSQRLPPSKVSDRVICESFLHNLITSCQKTAHQPCRCLGLPRNQCMLFHVKPSVRMAPAWPYSKASTAWGLGTSRALPAIRNAVGAMDVVWANYTSSVTYTKQF